MLFESLLYLQGLVNKNKQLYWIDLIKTSRPQPVSAPQPFKSMHVNIMDLCLHRHSVEFIAKGYRTGYVHTRFLSIH